MIAEAVGVAKVAIGRRFQEEDAVVNAGLWQLWQAVALANSRHASVRATEIRLIRIVDLTGSPQDGGADAVLPPTLSATWPKGGPWQRDSSPAPTQTVSARGPAAILDK